LTLTGWNRAGDALILDHLQIWGSPDDDQTWGELDALLRSNWRHPWGGHLRVDATVVDSGAWTQRVHDFCFPRLARRIWAGKGVAGHHPIFAPSRGKVFIFEMTSEANALTANEAIDNRRLYRVDAETGVIAVLGVHGMPYPPLDHAKLVFLFD
jgi:phage terminase large subunit GpA-like protein